LKLAYVALGQKRLETPGLDQGSPNYGRRRNFVIDEKIMYCIYENLLVW